MNTRTAIVVQSLLVAGFVAMPSFAADDEALKKDLMAVIALHGLPCGKVVTVREQAASDYAVSCEDGNKYHVYINAEERVMVEKQASASR